MIVLPHVLTPEELHLAREFLETATFEAGRLTATGLAAQRKDNLQAARSSDPEGLAALDRVILAGLERQSLFSAYAWPRRLTAPLYARYEPGMRYGAHVDGTLMGVEPKLRSDLSVTLFLGDPSTYDGGELALNLGGGAIQTIKLPAGTAFAYPTTLIHEVRPVTRGRRDVAVLWAQSYSRDPGIREVLFNLRAVNSSLQERAPNSVEAQLLQKTLLNLERRFLEN